MTLDHPGLKQRRINRARRHVPEEPLTHPWAGTRARDGNNRHPWSSFSPLTIASGRAKSRGVRGPSPTAPSTVKEISRQPRKRQRQKLATTQGTQPAAGCCRSSSDAAGRCRSSSDAATDTSEKSGRAQDTETRHFDPQLCAARPGPVSALQPAASGSGPLPSLEARRGASVAAPVRSGPRAGLGSCRRTEAGRAACSAPWRQGRARTPAARAAAARSPRS
jgi:hypothetical protein